MSFFDELKRRNVIRVAAGYIVLAWLVIQVAETILPFYGVPDTTIRLLITILAVLFIPVVILAWVFEWTPQGIRVDEGDTAPGPANLAMAKRWDRIVMVILALAVTFFIVENILEKPTDIQPAIVVLPSSGNGDRGNSGSIRRTTGMPASRSARTPSLRRRTTRNGCRT